MNEMTTSELIQFLRNNMFFLEGMASTMPEEARRALITKVCEIRKLLNSFEAGQSKEILNFIEACYERHDNRP